MASVIQQVSEWAAHLPFWEQAALERICNGVSFTERDYADVLQHLLEDGELAAAGPRPALTFPQSAGDAAAADARPVRLVKISDLRNVNALAPDQTLAFGDKLTTIFGANGSGKSGYARVLGSAGFTRGDRAVLDNVMCPREPGTSISAEIEVADASGACTPIHYVVGEPHPDLRFFYVFDTTSVRVHLTRSNTLSFAPAGLSHLTALADVTDEVRKRLQLKIAEKRRPNPFLVRFERASDVVTELSKLDKDNDLSVLRALATLSPTERADAKRLTDRIAELEGAPAFDALAPLRSQCATLSAKRHALERAEMELGDAALASIGSALDSWREAQAAAERESIEQFRTGGVEGLGTPAWHQFMEAARRLAHAQTDHAHPREGDPCLLCHRPIEGAQVEMLQRLWAFLDGAANDKLKAARAVLDQQVHRLASIDLGVADDAAIAGILEAHDPSALALLKEKVEGLRRRRDELVVALRNREDPPTDATAADSAAGVIASLVTMLEAQVSDLSKQDTSEELAGLRRKLIVLDHRERLTAMLPEIEAYVADRQWAARADKPKVRGSTNHITSKYNELFAALVTDRYIELFQEILTKLNCPRRVKVRTKGQKGETRKQVVLEMPTGALADGAPDKVLSEGEQRAVALADFFTELALDDDSAGIVLDDPVTSLDFEWKETIARYIVDESKRRQVIVFTHDLHFLYCLTQLAEDEKDAVVSHWIEKRDGTPGYVFLDNSPASEKEYKQPKKVSDILNRATAKGTPPVEQQRLLADGFGALRTCYEAFVMFEVFGGVVRRFEERMSIERLRTVVFDATIRDEVIEKVGLLSRYIEGHLHSDNYVAQKPTPELLRQELDSFEALKKRHKALKKANGVVD